MNGRLLTCETACPSAGDGGGAAGGYADYQGELLLLDGPQGLVEALEQGKDVTLGTGGVRACREMRALLNPWLPPRGLLEWYHVFESYRQGGLDSVLTEAVFHALSGQVDQNGDALQVEPGRASERQQERQRETERYRERDIQRQR